MKQKQKISTKKNYDTQRNRLLHNYNARNNNARFNRHNQISIMKSSHVLALKFIIAMKDNKDVEWLEVFNPKEDEDWEYYYQVNGYLNEKSFWTIFSKHTKTSIEKVTVTGIASQEINQILESL